MVPAELISALHTAYNEYTISYKSETYINDSVIGKSLNHVGRVVENIKILAESLELSENEKQIAEIIAQFHDIGRIWMTLPENSELQISDHAIASTEYLKASPVFIQLDATTQNIIIQAIKNHNKPELPKNEGETILFYTKLLRDADKLDCWRSTSEFIMRKGGKPNMVSELPLVFKPIVTPSLLKTIIESGGVPKKGDIVTFSDLVIFQMSWIFDLNFKKSFQLINQKQYIRHLYDTLPKNDNVIEIYRMIRIHIENHL